MPGPALRLTRQATHPVVNTRKIGDFDHHQPAFHISADSFYPSGGPASTRASRQLRVSWTASWRSQRPHKLWEDTEASPTNNRSSAYYDLASTSYKESALAPIFPSLSFTLPTSYERRSASLEDDVGSEYSGIHGNGSEWSDGEDEPMIDAYQTTRVVEDQYPDVPECASPLLDDMSPIDAAEPGSSPGPVTPFGDYVDRAVPVSTKGAAVPTQRPFFKAQGCGPECSQCQNQYHLQQAIPNVEKPAPIVTPSATEEYRKLADHFAAWISDYVWKLCTTLPGYSKSS